MVGKRVPSLHSPWNPSSLRTHLSQTSDPVRFPAAPEDRLRIQLGQSLHPLMLQAGSMLLDTLRSALRGRLPLDLHPDRPLPQWTSLSDVEDQQTVGTAQRGPESYA